MTGLLLSDSLPDRSAETAVRQALGRHQNVEVGLVEGAVPLEVRREAWEAVRAKYLPTDRVSIGLSRSGESFRVHTAYCRRCDEQVDERSCPHGDAGRVTLSDEQLSEILRAGGNLPRELYRPEVGEVLRRHLLATQGELAGADARFDHRSDAQTGGFILWFTGLSGAGKSTLSKAVAKALEGRVRFEVLDGDEVRTYLSKGLGFSREDRDTNVRRIGYVARLLARSGTPVITAAISPYREIREEIRALAEKDGVPFIEVFASASIDALAARDVKGLYQKALAGELAHFTGVSDPYEAPANAEIVVHTDRDPVSLSVDQILSFLRERGLVPAALEVA